MRPFLTALAVLSLGLTACATRSPDLPTGPIEQPRPIATDPRLCQPPVPEPPVRGGIVTPANEAERTATEEFLQGEAEARRWGRFAWELLAVARKACAR